MAGGGAEIRDGGERARGADAGGARRSGTWNCLCDGCQGRTRRQDRRHLPCGFPSRHHLSGRGDDDRKGGRRRLSRLPALLGSEDDPRKIWIHFPDPSDLLIAPRVRSLASVMAGDPAFAAGCHGCDAGGDAARDRRGVAAGATRFLGPPGRRCAGLPAAGAAAGRHRLSAAADIRATRPRRRVARGPSRHRFCVLLDRPGAALACGIMSFPLLVRPIRLSIEAVDRRLEQAAGTLGASPWRVFLTITLPLALPGVLAGMVLGFAKAIGEFGATITFVSNIPGETQTISSAIYSLIQTPDGDTAALRLVIVSIVIAMAALVASEWFARRALRRLHGN